MQPPDFQGLHYLYSYIQLLEDVTQLAEKSFFS